MTTRNNRWPVAIPRQPVKSKRPRIRVPEPAPGESWVERFCTPARRAEMTMAEQKQRRTK